MFLVFLLAQNIVSFSVIVTIPSFLRRKGSPSLILCFCMIFGPFVAVCILGFFNFILGLECVIFFYVVFSHQIFVLEWMDFFRSLFWKFRWIIFFWCKWWFACFTLVPVLVFWVFILPIAIYFVHLAEVWLPWFSCQDF